MKIVSAKALRGFRLQLHFENGESGIADLSDIAGRGVLSAWNDRSVFENVRVTEEGAVEWQGELDLCGDALYLRAMNKKPAELFPKIANKSNA